MANSHATWMQRCLDLAAKGLGKAAPNPLVGSLLVARGQLIGEGYHTAYGQPHAEVMALRNCSAPELLPEATLYVNLEPCAHQGKTPACAPQVVQAGIKRVVVCNSDPFPEVNGKGISILQNAGIEVTTGVLEEKGTWLNRRFFHHIQTGRPWVILKWAQSADGYMAPSNDPQGKVHWITSPDTQALTHTWRTEEQAILAGAGTVLADNPSLDVRAVNGKNPLRVILDDRGEVPASAKVFTVDDNVLHVTNARSSAEAIAIPRGPSFVDGLLEALGVRGIQSVLIEGGGGVLNAFIAQNHWNEARILTGSNRLNGGLVAPDLKGREIAHSSWSGDSLSVRLPA